jgi:hypothetical protein
MPGRAGPSVWTSIHVCVDLDEHATKILSDDAAPLFGKDFIYDIYRWEAYFTTSDPLDWIDGHWQRQVGNYYIPFSRKHHVTGVFYLYYYQSK